VVILPKYTLPRTSQNETKDISTKSFLKGSPEPFLQAR
jgi:hypothetical protein